MSGTQTSPRQLPSPPPSTPRPETRRDAAIWSTQRSGAPTLPILAFLHMRRFGFLLLFIVLGVLVSTTLLGTVPIYASLVSNVQIQDLFASSTAQDVNVETVVTMAGVSPDTANQIDGAASPLGRQLLSGFAPRSTEFLDASPLSFTSLNGQVVASGPTQPYADLAESAARPFAFDYTQALPHMRLLAGRLPSDVPAGQMPEALATPELGKLGVHAGDTIGLQVSGSNATSFVRVVGVWSPKDPKDPFWNGHDYNTANLCLLNCPPPQYPLLFTRQGFFSALAPFAQNQTRSNVYFAYSYRVYLHYLYFTDPTRLTTQNLPATTAVFATYHTRLNAGLPYALGVYSVQVATRLDTLLRGLQDQFALLAQPLYIVVAQIVALALLFVAVVIALLVDERSGAIATLRSRGASRPQIVACLILLSIIPAVLAAAGGLLLAPQLALYLIRISEPAPTIANGAYLASATSPTTALAGCLLGFGLTILAVAVASWQATRKDILAYRQDQARSGRVPFWKRNYLDIALALLCLVGYVELGRFGGLDIRQQLGQSSAAVPDPLQIAAPLLLLLAGALFALRLLPPVARMFAWLAGRGRGAAQMLAFSQVARASGAFTRLTLLLTLAVGLSVFALTFRATLDRNAVDRAAYAAGGDQIMQLDPIIQQTKDAELLDSHVATLPGVRAATPIVREAARAQQNQGSGDIGLLGIAPDSFASVAYWRSDYASQPLATLLAAMRQHEAGPNAGDADHPIWALVSTSMAAALDLKPGDQFTVVLQTGAQGNLVLTVGAVVNDFPTMFNSYGAGWLVVNESDLLAALANVNIGNLPGSSATEYWLRTTGRPADDAARAAALHQLQLELLVPSVIDRHALIQQYQHDPVTAGLSGLLALGALLAVLLTGIACFVYANTSARRRISQFAILRTLGMTARQIQALLLSESAVMYVFGLVGGLALGIALSTATLPFLDYTAALQDPATVGVPPYALDFAPPTLAILFAAFLLFFVIALAIQAGAATRAGLGSAMRIGED